MKSEHLHWILHTWVGLGTIFQLNVTILSFWTKFTRDGYFRSVTENVNTIFWHGLEIVALKAIPVKYYLVNSREQCNKTITNKKWKKVVGIKIYKELKFKGHSQSLFKKASQKINALSRGVAYIMNFEQRQLITNRFITSCFSNFLVTWIFDSQK